MPSGSCGWLTTRRLFWSLTGKKSIELFAELLFADDAGPRAGDVVMFVQKDRTWEREHFVAELDSRTYVGHVRVCKPKITGERLSVCG